MVTADGRFGRMISAVRTRPWLHLTVSPWWARVLIAGGAKDLSVPVAPVRWSGAAGPEGSTQVHALPGGAERVAVAVDIARPGDRLRDDPTVVSLHRGMYDVLSAAFADAGIAWDASLREDHGDGVLIVVPPQTRPATVMGPLVNEIARHVRRLNSVAAPSARLRLRMAVHSGPAHSETNGLTGRDLAPLFRMLDAPAFKKAFADSGGDLGVATSERLHHDVIEPGRATEFGEYLPIEMPGSTGRMFARLPRPRHSDTHLQV